MPVHGALKFFLWRKGLSFATERYKARSHQLKRPACNNPLVKPQPKRLEATEREVDELDGGEDGMDGSGDKDTISAVHAEVEKMIKQVQSRVHE